MKKEAVIRINESGLWTCDLYTNGDFNENIGGEYIQVSPCKFATHKKWGHNIIVHLTYSSSVEHISNELKSGRFLKQL